jgi:hypothetical protein
MTLKQIRIAALAATFIAGGATFAHAQSVNAKGSASANMGNSGDTQMKGLDRADDVAGQHGAQGRANARVKSGHTSSTVGASGSVNTKSNSGPNKLKGLNRADEVAGQHGAAGRANARSKNKNY